MIKNKNIDPNAAIDATKMASNVISTTGTQTLTNKTLTSPVITSPTITAAVVSDDSAMNFGTGSDVTITFNNTRNCLVVNGNGIPVEVRGLNMAKDRYELVERFHKAPKINADILDATEATNEVANRDFELLGTNAVSADSTLYAEGGLALATHGATNDSSIILPHLDTGESAWKVTTWGTDQATRYEVVLQTPAAVTECEIWAGLKLTNTPVVATDNEQAFFKYDSAAGADPTLWHTIFSIGGTDTEAGVGSAIAAATTYHLVIDINSSRVAKFYINGTLVTTSTALTTATDLIPYVGIKDTSAGSARILYVFKQAISRDSGA